MSGRRTSTACKLECALVHYSGSRLCSMVLKASSTHPYICVLGQLQTNGSPVPTVILCTELNAKNRAMFTDQKKSEVLWLLQGSKT